MTRSSDDTEDPAGKVFAMSLIIMIAIAAMRAWPTRMKKSGSVAGVLFVHKKEKMKLLLDVLSSSKHSRE